MRSFVEWISLVDEYMLAMGGITTSDLPVPQPYRHWWAMGSSPRWAARQALSMDNG